MRLELPLARLRPCRRQTPLLALSLGALLCLRVDAAAAQTTRERPAPGRIEERYEEPLRPPAPRAPLIPRIEQAPTPEQAREVRFVLSGVDVVGSTAYDPAAFVPLYEKHLVHEVSLAELHEIAGAITAMYQRDGFVLSHAVVPEQEARLGLVRIQVVEGWVPSVTVRGDVRGRSALLEGYGRKITASRPVTLNVLERYLLLMEDLPGVTARVALASAEQDPGAHELSVFLEHDTLEASARFDNRGTRRVGPFQAWFAGGANSVLGLYEQTRLRMITTPQAKELRYVEFSQSVPLGPEGTVVTLTGSRLLSEPGSTLDERLEFEESGVRGELVVVHPFLRSNAANLFLTSRLTYRNDETRLLGRTAIDDRLRVVGLGGAASFGDPLGGSDAVSLELSHGLDVLGASPPGSLLLSRASGRSDFTKVTLEVARTQPLFSVAELFLTARGQKSADALLESEQMGLGGEVYGRAYDPSEIIGDDGAAFGLELRRGALLDWMFLTSYQVYVAYDVGAVWSRGLERASLASAGIGLRLGLAGGVSGDVELDQPLTRPVGVEGDGPRVFFRLNRSF